MTFPGERAIAEQIQPGSFYGQAGRATPGAEAWIEETSRELDLDAYYIPHLKQQNFHESPVPHRLLGGAAGPGKSLALIMDHLAGCLSFSDPLEACQVHTLLLRRTHPQLEGSLIPRFREKVPRELYRSYNEQKKIVTWPNGAQSHFGSMQYEQDVWNYQGGQYWKIGFDELTQFTLYQWFTISAWNRCPVSIYATKDGATNPVGVSASAFACLFGADGKGKRPAPSMDDNQKANYNPDDYAYFPCTYLDNPIYAQDPVFIKNLENYPGPLRDALKFGKWGSLGTYFDLWDEALHVYPLALFPVKAYWPVWLSGDWGFVHDATTYWHTIDERGICRTFHEYVTNHREPADLAQAIAEEHNKIEATMAVLHGGGPYHFRELLPWMFYSHDAFHQKTSEHTLAQQMSEILKPAIGVELVNGGTDKLGGEQLMYSMLNIGKDGENGVKIGSRLNEATGQEIPIVVPKWQVADSCGRLIAIMPQAPRDEDKIEQIAKFEGDDPIDGARQGIYGKFSGKVKLPDEIRIAARVTAEDPTIRALQAAKAQVEIRRQESGNKVSPKRWRPPIH